MRRSGGRLCCAGSQCSAPRGERYPLFVEQTRPVHLPYRRRAVASPGARQHGSAAPRRWRSPPPRHGCPWRRRGRFGCFFAFLGRRFKGRRRNRLVRMVSIHCRGRRPTCWVQLDQIGATRWMQGIWRWQPPLDRRESGRRHTAISQPRLRGSLSFHATAHRTSFSPMPAPTSWSWVPA